MYLITFHSQFDSNVFKRKMKEYGDVRQKPVPRSLSSACGTCCVFTPSDPWFNMESVFTKSFEKVYRIREDGSYDLLCAKD